jgi:hypothetical protein
MADTTCPTLPVTAMRMVLQPAFSQPAMAGVAISPSRSPA